MTPKVFDLPAEGSDSASKQISDQHTVFQTGASRLGHVLADLSQAAIGTDANRRDWLAASISRASRVSVAGGFGIDSWHVVGVDFTGQIREPFTSSVSTREQISERHCGRIGCGSWNTATLTDSGISIKAPTKTLRFCDNRSFWIRIDAVPDATLMALFGRYFICREYSG